MSSFIIAQVGDQKVKIIGTKSFCDELLKDPIKLTKYIKSQMRSKERDQKKANQRKEFEINIIIAAEVLKRELLWNRQLELRERSLFLKEVAWEEIIDIVKNDFDLESIKAKWQLMRKSFISRMKRFETIEKYKQATPAFKHQYIDDMSLMVAGQIFANNKEDDKKPIECESDEDYFVEEIQSEPNHMKVKENQKLDNEHDYNADEPPPTKFILLEDKINLENLVFKDNSLPNNTQASQSYLPQVINQIPIATKLENLDSLSQNFIPAPTESEELEEDQIPQMMVDEEVDGFIKQIRALMSRMSGRQRNQFAIDSLIKAQNILYGRAHSDPNVQ